MKKVLAVLALVAAAAAQATPISGFTGAYNFLNWQTTFTAPCTGCMTVHTATSLTLTGADGDADTLDHFTDRFITFTSAATVSFDWTYRTADDPIYDPLGVITNDGSGVLFTQLSDDQAGSPQSGSRSFMVNAGDVFGFRVWSIGSDFGAATGIISNFSVDELGQVPEPASLALVGIGLLGAAAARRRIAV